MFGKKKDTANVQKAVAAAASFEITIGDLARKSERRAWTVAFCSLVMSLALAGGYYFMLPLKEKVPYVVMADPFSGTASVAALRDDPFYRQLVANEVMSRANIANYVVARESFDVELLKARDWAQVNVMSSADQRKVFASTLAANNPTSPANLVGANQSMRVRISSITPIYDRSQMVGATVRIQRNLFNRQSGDAAPIDRRVITLTFRYDKNLKLEERLRWRNPLGFLVMQYRSDLDMSAMEPGNLDSAFQDAVDSASQLLQRRDDDLEALKAQVRALATAGFDGGNGGDPADASGDGPTKAEPPFGDPPAVRPIDQQSGGQQPPPASDSSSTNATDANGGSAL
jgi:type IV secretion system protein VirB8